MQYSSLSVLWLLAKNGHFERCKQSKCAHRNLLLLQHLLSRNINMHENSHPLLNIKLCSTRK